MSYCGIDHQGGLILHPQNGRAQGAPLKGVGISNIGLQEFPGRSATFYLDIHNDCAMQHTAEVGLFPRPSILLQFFYIGIMIQRFRVAEGILVENRLAFDNFFDRQFDFFHIQGIGDVRCGKNF